MRIFLSSILCLLFMSLALVSCDSNSETDTPEEEGNTVIDVDPALFVGVTSVETVSCTLSDGTAAECYEIIASTPVDHAMGPWCPANISDGAEAGGIWLENDQVFDVDGAFIENMATFYNDETWRMYDENGDIFVTETEDDCINAANPNVGEAYQNFCVECSPDYITDLERTWLIPATPVLQTSSTAFAGRGPGGGAGASIRGIAFNGVEFSAAAPVDAILGAYTLAPFDDAGGHINVNQGYHYHAATGISTQITQDDGHAPMIGYAADGHGIYAELDEDGNEPGDLDACRGQYDDTRGYHYHVDQPGSNNFINCLFGAYAN